jgi:hypothetical protein
MNTQEPQDKQTPSAKEQIRLLYVQKTHLLNKYGVFGGEEVNRMHQRINEQLEALGVDPNS